MRLAVFRDRIGARSEPYIEAQAGLLTDEYRLFGLEDAGDITSPVHWTTPKGVHFFENICYRGFCKAPILRSAILRYRPDVILAHFALDAIRLNRALPTRRPPLVAYLHGSDALTDWWGPWAPEGHSSKVLAAGWKTLREMDGVVCASEFIASKAIERGVPQHLVSVGYVGCPVIPFAPVERDPQLALFVGRMQGNKGLDVLLDALAIGQTGYRLDVVGEGPGLQAAMERTRRLNLQNRVRFLGALPHSDTRRKMREALVVAVPSLPVISGASEGFGLVAVEAQMEGAFVVASRVGGLPEALGSPNGARLVTPGDPAALSGALNSAFVDPQGTLTRAAVAQKWALETFDMRITAARLRGILMDSICRANNHDGAALRRTPR